jgi:hypothetical protein
VLALVVLAATAECLCLRNQWVQDDRPIIVMSPVLHSLAHWWQRFTQAYWPDPYPRELYRPLTSLLLSVEWVLGGGHVVVFRAMSLVLAVGSTLAVYRLATRVLPSGGAWLAAAFFAVHPVHVEAVAVAINQAELAVGLLLALLTAAYLDRRRAGLPLSAGWIATMSAGYLVASLFKESALVLPGMIVVAEVVLIADQRPWRDRIAMLRPLILAFMLVAVALIYVRNMVLAGDTKGTFTAEALTGLTFTGRAITMLGVVPDWVRLLFWPSQLRAEYSPGVIVGTTHWGMMQSLGALLLVALAAIAWRVRRTRPAITFGICWIAIGIFPVSNVLVPTGITLAERTLFLASIGAVLIAGDVAWLIGHRLYSSGGAPRLITVAALGAILGMGLTRSMSRQLVWHDLPTLWRQTLVDAPLSYRANFAYAQILFDAGLRRSAEVYYRRSMEIFPPAWPVPLDLADKYRLAGDCYPAVHLYQRVLVLDPYHTAARASLITCLVKIGDYATASREARIGEDYGRQPRSFAVYGAVADSAARVHAAPGTVRLPPPVDSIVP